MNGFLKGERHRHAAIDGFSHILTQIVFALFAHEAQLTKSVIAQDIVEARPVEAAVTAFEGCIVQNHAANGVVGHSQIELAHFLIQCGFRNHAPQNLLVEAIGARLLIGDGATRLALQHRDLSLIGLAELGRWNVDRADFSNIAHANAAENVAISAGGRTALTRVLATLGNGHLGHLLPDYTAYEELLGIFRAFVPIPIVLDPAEGFALTPARLRAEIVGKGLGAVLLSNPCNPTGQVVRGRDMRAWVETSRKLGCALILDEFYSHYLYDAAAASEGASTSAARFVEDVNEDPVILVDGLTKNWRYPGFRLAWTVGPRDVIERLTSAGSFLDGGPPHPMQRAALPLLAREHADREALAIQKAFAEKRWMMLERIRELGLGLDHVPLGAFYCFVSLENLPPALQDGHAFFRAALEREVIVVPGEFFDVNPGKRRSHIPSRLKSYVRLSFGPESEVVREGMDRLAGMIRDHA